MFTQSMPGSLRLFTFRRIDVYLHWTWAVVALLGFRFRADVYSHQLWNLAEYVALFGIVLLHEFGHAFACRSVGGRADLILLWPLGGMAYVQPPHRPGALLWSIAAGPLVNVALAPLTIGLIYGLSAMDAPLTADQRQFIQAIAIVNIVLLVFNMLPIYPLDGGQMLQALMWFFMPFDRALSIAAWIGMLGAGAGMGLALAYRDWWLILLALMAGMRCANGIRLAADIRAYRRQQHPTTPPRGL